MQRLIAAGLLGLSLVYLVTFVSRGWVPHDEGMIGQSAEQLLAGAVPHVDYQEPYTGGLTWLHAAVFRVAGVDLINPRWLLFGAAALAQILTYLILRRWLTPIPAALGTWVALAWSFPNYFAALPSWWVLIWALLSLWAFIKYAETHSLRYAMAAGLAAGLAIVVKQTGLYVLVALVMAMLYGGGRERDTPVWWPGRVACITVAVAAAGLALALMAARLALSDLLYLLLPIVACSRVLGTADGRDALFQRRHLAAPVAAVAAAAAPLAVFVVPYLFNGQLGDLFNGLFILPQKRTQFAAFEMPEAYWIAAGVPLIAMLMPLPPRVRHAALSRNAGITLAVIGSIVVAISISNTTAYQLLWQSARAFAALLPVAAGWLVLSGQERDTRKRWILFGCVTMLAWASLVQIPFSAPIYFCYATPLAVIAAVAVAGTSAALARPAVTAVAAVLLLFAVVTMNRGYIYNLGAYHARMPLNVPLGLERAHLTVSEADATNYRRVLDLIDAHIGNGELIAGPDCPEIYFLTQRVSPTGTLFDFFGDHVSPEGWVTDLPGWQSARVIVLNHGRRFSLGPSVDFIATIRKAFPHGEAAGSLEVRWR